jgi:acetoin utilization deacetylase AcuC-like enzyme
VAILDFDVHLGNGTEDIFRDDPRVLLCSSYQYPLWPNLDPPTVPGRIVNCALPPGSGSEAFRKAVTEHWVPELDAFRPQLLLISAGFDAHAADDMANLRLTTADYGWITDVACAVAERHAKGRIVSTLEGGYDLRALAASVATHIERLLLA